MTTLYRCDMCQMIIDDASNVRVLTLSSVFDTTNGMSRDVCLPCFERVRYVVEPQAFPARPPHADHGFRGTTD